MARLNTASTLDRTHEGAPAQRLTAEQRLRRSVLACMLWEDSFYEEGEAIAQRIAQGVAAVPAETVEQLTKEARQTMNLRHAPLMLASAACMVHGGKPAERAVFQAICRADELAEIVAIHARNNGVGPDRAKKVLGAAMKRGLAQAFRRFDAYELAKYDRKGAIKLRDVLFMTHAKPKDAEQEATWRQLVDGTLAAPDTWEVQFSRGADKRATFERLLGQGKLGYMALLRNLRKMDEVGVDEALVKRAIRDSKGAKRVLPFRFVAAARHAPRYEPELAEALQANLASMEALPGGTVVLVDVSGSMECSRVARKSDMTRLDAAASLGSLVPGDVRVFSFSNDLVEVPRRPGIAGVDAIIHSQDHKGTKLGHAVERINASVDHDRLIVISDEQSHDPVPNPIAPNAYMINVASYANGVGYGAWTHIDGFSEAVIRYIAALERKTAAVP